MRPEILSIQPAELRFPFEAGKQLVSSLKLVNTAEDPVAFKVKTTAPKKYCVRPNTGLILPGFTCEVTVTMQAQNEAPADMLCKDKFLVQSVVTSEGFQENEISQDLFNKEPGKDVFEMKLKVVYTSPPQPVVSAPEASITEASPVSSFASIQHKREDTSNVKEKLVETRAQISKVTQEKEEAVLKAEKLCAEIASLTGKTGGAQVLTQSQATGFSFLFVLAVGLLGIIVGYFLRS